MALLKKKDEDRKPIEQEIAELTRKFRVLENDKRACSEDSQGTIRKQRATIEKLTRENRKMKSELNDNRSAPGSGPEGKIALEKIGKLSTTLAGLRERVEAERDLAKEIDDRCDNANEEIFNRRGEMAKHGGINAGLDNNKAVQKQIRILENRLDKGLQKFNEAIAANRSLREQIDGLRRERVVFDDIYRKLENELQQKKREMANIIEQANAAYEARDSAQGQMASLKQQADKEHQEFEKEWKELGKLVENDKRMKEFMKTKARGQREDTGAGAAAEDERQRQKLTARNAWQSSKSQVALTENQEKVAGYEEAFAKIQKATGRTDIDELVHNFLNDEDKNFSLFKYNNELTVEIEKLQENIADYKEEYVALSGSGSRKEDTEKAKILETLEEKWNDIDKKADNYEVKYQESRQTLTHVRNGIETIFKRLGCSADDLPSGCGLGISEANMMLYLASIEGRTNEFLKVYDTLKQDDEDYDGISRPAPKSSTALHAPKLPSTVEDYSDDDEDEDDDDQRPFTRDELKAKTLRGINNRKKKQKKSIFPGDK